MGEKTTIDCFGFELEQLPGWTHVEATARLGRLIGAGWAPLAKVFNQVEKAGKDDPEAKLMLAGVIIDLIRRAPVDEMMVFSRQLLTGCKVSSSDPTQPFKPTELEPLFDKLFRKKPTVPFKLIAWAIQVNFAGFFDELKSAMPALKSPQSQAPSTSTSPSPSETTGPVVD